MKRENIIYLSVYVKNIRLYGSCFGWECVEFGMASFNDQSGVLHFQNYLLTYISIKNDLNSFNTIELSNWSGLKK